ncbi:hypothetical protein Kfla_1922 [Kribbella flavida DSM 17836]|uniref:Uncharacterized protein n=1 Tax=Kribbella flavida (strain DSM 17836 / JCM 10339 / NBRC 14399) TaxID=479435 RepID=D2PPQ4_KRIFD|nr:hypothetical protein [Kribbella flavida]ADB31016.1 hypothetical protein Kfla_1922 [Kribbella flavida DSM 17836]
MYHRLIWTLPKDALAVVRAYPRIVVCFAGALAGTALVFDVFYLVASPGLTLALVYTVPVLAGLIAGLVAAADDVGLERRVLIWTVWTTIALGITNAVVVAMLAAMRRTGPADWAAGGQAVLFAACSVLVVAVTIVVIGKLVRVLGIEVQTRWPVKAAPVAPPAVTARPVESKEAAARAPVRRPAPPPEPPAEDPYGDPYSEPFEPVVAYVPRVVDLDEPREVTPWGESTGHADRRVPRRRTGPSVPPSRRSPRPGRRPER